MHNGTLKFEQDLRKGKSGTIWGPRRFHQEPKEWGMK
jgi:hypothetical protein